MHSPFADYARQPSPSPSPSPLRPDYFYPPRAGQHGATAAELRARAGHASQAAMAIYQHATVDRDRDRQLAKKLGDTVTVSKAWSGLLGKHK